MPGLWTARKDGGEVWDPDVAKDVTDVIAQVRR